MTAPRDPDRLIHAFLEDGQTELPAQVYDAVRAEIEQRPQRATTGPWRTPTMSRFVAIGLGTAAVVAVLLIGSRLMGSPTIVGPGATQSAAPSAEPSSAYGTYPPPNLPTGVGCGELQAGTYRAPIGTLSVTVTVPAVSDGLGWIGSSGPNGFWMDSRGPCWFGGGPKLEISLVSDVYLDACHRQDTVETDTPAAVTAALAAQTGHETSGPVDTTLGGYPASRFEFLITDAGPCSDNRGPSLWHLPGTGDRSSLEIHDTDTVTVWVVDVGGTALAVAAINPDARLDAVVASLRIEPFAAQPSTPAVLSCCIPPGDESPVAGPFVIWDDAHGGYNVTVSVQSSGWAGAENQHVLIYDNNVDPPDGALLLVSQTGDVPPDPCAWLTNTSVNTQDTVDGYVAALGSQASRDASEPEDIAVAGHPGKAIILHVPEDAVFAHCDQGVFVTLTDAVYSEPLSVAARYAQGPGQIDQFWIVDVAGSVVMFDLAYGAETPQTVINDMRAMVESATFGAYPR